MQIYSVEEYREWIRCHDVIDDAARRSLNEHIEQFENFPLFSIVALPGGAPPEPCLQALFASLQKQVYTHWELVVPAEWRAVLPAGDARVVSIGSNPPSTCASPVLHNALGQVRGEYVMPLPVDTHLAERALYEIASVIDDDPAAHIVYGDEDRLDRCGERCDPWFKTGWDPDLALESDAIGVPAAYETALINASDRALWLLGPRVSSHRPFLLRTALAASPAHIHHVARVLCHRAANTDDSTSMEAEEMRTAVRDYLTEDGVDAEVVPAPGNDRWSWVLRGLPDPAPLVSIIVPTRDRADLLDRCITSLLSNTDYPAIEVLVVDNDSQEPATIALLRRLCSHRCVRVLPYPGKFNYAAMNNFAAREANGEILVLLNNDTESIRPDWLRAMTAHALRAEVGAVGARLLYPDGRVQHAGMVFQPGVGPLHQYRFADRNDPGPAGALRLTRSVQMVTGACLALRRAVYFEVGGLDESLRVAFNDVDLCMRLGDRGYRAVCTPTAELYHFESASRGYDVTPEKQELASRELAYFRHRWGSLSNSDPFRNPNLNFSWNGIELAVPPWSSRVPRDMAPGAGEHGRNSGEMD